MRTTARWAFFRRLQYYTGFALLGVLLGTFVYFNYIYQAATCFDGTQNGDEAGVDCGGSCVRMCAFEVTEPRVSWVRSFRVTDGLYNAVAYVENVNRVAATAELRYTFTLYDEQGVITERQGKTILPPNNVYPVFEGRINTGGRVPTRTFIDFEPIDTWQPATTGREQFVVVERELTKSDSKPKLDAIIHNESLEEAREVEIVATIFDANGNALTASRTYLDNFAPRSDQEVIFTWPEPIATTVRSCEVPTDVVVAIDLSGSMNNDGGEPAEPISSVKAAARSFIDRLTVGDQVSLVTFATDAVLASPLSLDKVSALNAVAALTIDPKEETGSTNTGEAIKRAGEEILSSRHNEDARKVAVLLTDGLATAPDGNPEEYALGEAATLRAAGVELYVIGLGQDVNMDFVRAVATDPSYAYQALTTSDVDRIYQTITAAICEDGPAVIDIVAKSDAGFVPLR